LDTKQTKRERYKYKKINEKTESKNYGKKIFWGNKFLSKKCTPTCPYFRCAKRALIIKRNQRHGGNQRYRQNTGIAICTWANDRCEGSKCTFAFCAKRALLPDGTCGLELRKRHQKIRSIEDEAEKEEISLKIRGKAFKKLKDIEL